MYTFLISVGFFFLICAIIFKKKIKQHWFPSFLIIFVGTLISCSIVNGVVGLKYPLKFEKVKVKPLGWYESEIKLPDTTLEYLGHISLDLKINKNGHIIQTPRLHISRRLDYNYNKEKPDFINIYYLSPEDSVPRFERFREQRTINNHWVSSIGVPRGKRYYNIYLPKDSIHVEIVNQINKYFYGNDTN